MVRFGIIVSLVLFQAHTSAAQSLDELQTNTTGTDQDEGSWQWPAVLSAEQRYYPEDEHLYKRGGDALKRLETQRPIGVRKMSSDPSEMFFLDYWVFAPESPEKAPAEKRDDAIPLLRAPLDNIPEDDDSSSLSNSTSLLQPPFRPQAELDSSPWSSQRFFARNIFDKRSFQCPTGTSACTSISRPNSCCSSDESCVIVKDTGLGDVGCCPKGQTCGSSIAGCQTDLGYKSCPGSPNGGCCIPGYACEDVGCIASSVSTTTKAPAIVTVTMTVTPNAVTSTSTSAPPPPPTTTPPATVTVFTTLPANTTVVVVSGSTVTECGSGLNSCAASLGGGCCPSDRSCVAGGGCQPTSTSSSSSSSETSPGAAVRPTSGSDSSSSTSTSTLLPSVCPTGFYMCSARYVGGCCRVDRQCQSTSCLGGPSTTVASNGATIVVPVGGAADTASAVATVNVAATTTSRATTSAAGGGGSSGCATGWFSCAAGQGGGCCPTGYVCGASCSSTAGAGPTQVNKLPPISAATAAGHGVADALGLWLALVALLLGGGGLLL